MTEEPLQLTALVPRFMVTDLQDYVRDNCKDAGVELRTVANSQVEADGLFGPGTVPAMVYTLAVLTFTSKPAYDVVVGLVSNALYDALKRFTATRQVSDRFEITIKSSNGAEIKISTNKPLDFHDIKILIS